MIVVVAVIIGAIIVGLKTPLLSPLVFLSKFKKKSLFIILFFIYCLVLGYELRITNVYNVTPITIFAVILPTILLLDAGLKNDKDSLSKFLNNKTEYTIAIGLLIGLFVKYIFAIALLIVFFQQFSDDHPKKGALVLISVLLLVAGLILGRQLIDFIGGASTQVIFISSISILTTLIFYRSKIKRYYI